MADAPQSPLIMHTAPIIHSYFPHLTETQYGQIAALPDLYTEWNEKINVVSRRDIDQIMEHHILHSLVIGCFAQFVAGTRIIDIGTGGGFPGIPMAILFPEVHFTLVDSIGKKVRVAQAVADHIGLRNVNIRQSRAEAIEEKYDFAISRAAMSATDLVSIAKKVLHTRCANALPNGIIALKGGDLISELRPYRRIAMIEEVTTYFPELSYFEGKKIVYIPI